MNMNNFEIENVLGSLTVLIDTREQDTERARRRREAFSVPFDRATLDYGDYTYNAIINGEPLYNTRLRIYPSCVIERKMDLDELATCFTRERKRFTAEMERAKAHGARIILLIENGSWESLINGRYHSRLIPKSFFASLTAWMIRYNLQVIFCKSETSGKIIKELLYRDLKERLERGDFNDRSND